MRAAEAFITARNFLVGNREAYDVAYRDFRWPHLQRFNWALDYFDAYAVGNDRTALWVLNENGSEVRLSFAELSARSNRVANFLRARGARRGDRLLLMLPNVVRIWETLLAAMKLGVVVKGVPSSLVPAPSSLLPT